MANNRIQFKRFYGLKTQWNASINSNDWQNSIVFGQIKDDSTGKIEFKIYAGTVVTNSSTIKYIYNIPDIGEGVLSNVHIDVSTCEPDEYYIGQTPTHGDYYVKEEYLSYVNSDTGKNTLPSDPSAIVNQNIAPRRTAYIYDASLNNGTWVALDGNVNAENVYFPEGFQRTQPWGIATLKDDTKPDDEIIGKNLKEVFEYYLVQEKYNSAKKDATFSTGPWSIKANGGKSRPDNLYNYVYLNGVKMSSNSSIVEVGSSIKIVQIDVSTTPTLSGNVDSKSGSAAKIYNMFKYSINKIDIINDTSLSGSVPSVSFGYSDNFNTAEASLKLTSNNANIIPDSLTEGRINSSVILDEQNSSLPEGSLVLTLNYSNDLWAKRTINSSIPATSVGVYPVSNKGNISNTLIIANGINPLIDSSKSAHKDESVSNKISNVTVNAVYPIFTNGKVVASNANKSLFNWYNNTYTSYETDPSINKLSLKNYLASNQEYIVAFGDIDEATADYNCYVSVPQNMTFTVPELAELDSTDTYIASWIPNNMRNVWTKSDTVQIDVQGNQVSYDIYTNNKPGSAWAFKVQINKKLNN